MTRGYDNIVLISKFYLDLEYQIYGKENDDLNLVYRVIENTCDTNKSKKMVVLTPIEYAQLKSIYEKLTMKNGLGFDVYAPFTKQLINYNVDRSVNDATEFIMSCDLYVRNFSLLREHSISLIDNTNKLLSINKIFILAFEYILNNYSELKEQQSIIMMNHTLELLNQNIDVSNEKFVNDFKFLINMYRLQSIKFNNLDNLHKVINYNKFTFDTTINGYLRFAKSLIDRLQTYL